MTEFGSEPEIWVEKQPEPGPRGGWTGSTTPGGGFGLPPTSSDGPGGSGPPDGPRGRGHWRAVVAGFVLLAGALIVQRAISGMGSDADTSVPAPPTTPAAPPSTWTPFTPSSPPGTTTFSDTALLSASSYARPVLPTAPVTTSTSGDPPLAGGDWELVGFQWSGAAGSGGSAVVRYRPETGELVSTPVPALNSNGPLSFITTANAAIIRPLDVVSGYVVPDGRPAMIAPGLLSSGGVQILPSTVPDCVWLLTSENNRLTITLARSTGASTGTTLPMPASLGTNAMLTRDGSGYVLVRAVGGVYDIQPDKTRLVTHGTVLAVGPTGYLVYECDESAQCSVAVIDRASGERTTLKKYNPADSAYLGQVQGVISPDGHYAIVLDFSAGPELNLIDLHSGQWTVLDTSLNSQSPVWSDAASVFAFTPDSRRLLIAAEGGVDVVDPSTGRVTGQLPVPPLAAIAIRLAH